MTAQSDRPESGAEIEPVDLSPAIQTARRGFRRDTKPLVELLDRGAMFVPLAAPVPEAPLGENLSQDELTLQPHLVTAAAANGAESNGFAVLFTRQELLVEFAEEVGWTTTGEGDLQYCTLPARAGFDLAVQLIDDGSCVALVVNPSAKDELTLQRHELDALRQGQPTPLVGYVAEIPRGDDEVTLVSELDEPPSPDLVAALERCVERLPGVVGYRLEQTFNKERDIEPHPTLTLLSHDLDSVDESELEQHLAAELDGKLPAPGYIDVVFKAPDGGADA